MAVKPMFLLKMYKYKLKISFVLTINILLMKLSFKQHLCTKSCSGTVQLLLYGVCDKYTSNFLRS